MGYKEIVMQRHYYLTVAIWHTLMRRDVKYHPLAYKFSWPEISRKISESQ